jgi:serine/threonine protein kinase
MITDTDIIIGKKYKVLNLVGEGSFGKIFEAINIITSEKVAIKIEKKSTMSLLKHEATLYNKCRNIKGIPKLRNYGVEENYNYIVIDFLGDSLDDIKIKHGGHIDLCIVLNIGIQLINIIEKLHNIGIIHRDLKPENILLGLEKEKKSIYIIDFGISRFYINSKGCHIQYVDNKKYMGNIIFMSLNVSNGIEPTRRDDMESIGYILMYILTGYLPWNIIDDKDKNKDNIKALRNQSIVNMKRELPLDKVCENSPIEFKIYLEYCRKLEYDETPNYNYLKNIFINCNK